MKGKGIRSEEEIREKLKLIGWEEYISNKEGKEFETTFYIGAMMTLNWVLREFEILSADVEDYEKYDKEVEKE